MTESPAVVYWFSGTGNSIYAAERIRESLGMTARTRPVARWTGKVGELRGTIGLVFPVYAWGPPALILDFVDRLPEGSPDYVFAVATYAGSPGLALEMVERRLASGGIGLDAALALKMVSNYPPLGGAPRGEKLRRMLERAEMAITEASRVLARREKLKEKEPLKPLKWVEKRVYRAFSKHAPSMGSKFRSDGRCDGCGICVKICPAGNIDLPEDGRPSWGQRCLQCFACFHWCPREAVRFGRYGAGRSRYHHPGVNLKMMLEQGADGS